MQEVKSTCKLVSAYTVVADPERAREAKRHREQAIGIFQKRIRSQLEAAAGVPIVRIGNFCGSCIWLGLLVRETAKFYVYADGCRDAKTINDHPTKRILKSSVHLKPCKGCKDHPETNYPLG
ncbi:MAG: hypothetical protein R3C53_18995 [Pirellulaceae bacterium]